MGAPQQDVSRKQAKKIKKGGKIIKKTRQQPLLNPSGIVKFPGKRGISCRMKPI